MSGILASIIDGVLIGSVYGLAAMGLTLIWGVMDVINLTHGAAIVAGMFALYLLTSALGMPVYAALPPVLVGGFLFGVLLYWVAVHRMIGRPPLMSLLSTFAVNLVLVGLGTAVWGTDLFNVQVTLPGASFGRYTFPGTHILAALLTVAMAGLLYLFLYRTRLGKAVRAVAANREAAELSGIPTTRVLSMTFGLGVSLAGVAGMLIATLFPFTVLAGESYQLKSFVVTILGGLGNPAGALAGGVMLGLIEGLAAPFMPVSWTLVIEFVLFVGVLIALPGGLFGKRTLVTAVARKARAEGVSVLRRPFFWIIGLVIAIFAIAPAIGNNVELRESLILACVYITLASNLNLMLGYTGYINFGAIVFFGLGGYICLYLMSAHGWQLAAAEFAAGVAVSSLALVFGLGILRLRGAYFALATIGVNEAVQAFVSNFEPWGGSSGLYLSTELFNPLGGAMRALWVIYFLLVGVMGLSLYLSYAIKTSKFGLGLMAIGQNEAAATILGVPAPLYKALVYSVSAFLPAMAGGLYFFKSAFIQPVDAFDLGLSTEAMVIVMLGGQGTISGAVIGGYLYEELRGYLLTSESFSNFQMVIAGALLLLIVLFVPGGLMGFIYGRWPRFRRVLE